MTEEEQIALAIQMSMSDTTPEDAKGDEDKDSKMETEVCFNELL